jgi:hypothetical protein
MGTQQMNQLRKFRWRRSFEFHHRLGDWVPKSNAVGVQGLL